MKPQNLLSLMLTFSCSLLLQSAAPKSQINQGKVQFSINEVTEANQPNSQRTWLATYASSSGTAKFIISIDLKTKPNATPFQFSKGYFSRVAGSKPSAFLTALALALGARPIQKPTEHKAACPFDMAILGTDVTLEPRGGFSAKPGGGWITTKVFLSDGEAEVYLNLNPSIGIAEFSIKDEDYGDIVLRELATIL